MVYEARVSRKRCRKYRRRDNKGWGHSGKEWKESRPALKSCSSSNSGEKVIKRVMEYTSGGGWGPEAVPPSWGPLLLPWHKSSEQRASAGQKARACKDHARAQGNSRGITKVKGHVSLEDINWGSMSVMGEIHLLVLPPPSCDFSSCAQKEKDFKEELIKTETCWEGHERQRLKKWRVFEKLARGGDC